MAEKYKIRIVGCGGIAFGKHLPNIKQLGNINIFRVINIIFSDKIRRKRTNYPVKMHQYMPNLSINNRKCCGSLSILWTATLIYS